MIMILKNHGRMLADGGSMANATLDDATTQAQLVAKQAMLAFLRNRFHLMLLFLLLGYGIMCLLSTMLLMYMRLNRRHAFDGNLEAARKVILPAYEPLLAVLAGTTFVYSVFFTSALASDMYQYEISKLATEVFYSGRQFVFLSVIVFMLQRSVSGPALRRSVAITLMLSTYTIPIVWYMVTYGHEAHFYAVFTTARALLLLLYTYVFIRPPERATKRTLREFCVYAYIYYAFLFAYNECFQRMNLQTGFTLAYINLITGSLCPLVIWRVLRADTEHWRGFGTRAIALQPLFRQKHNIPERVSARGLHVLIEMHRKYIIDFAHLELKDRIGIGASAVVFEGVLRSKVPVAVKVYTPSDFTDTTIAEFSLEAALCGSLHHPNIVQFHGMCVCPPTICLVSELCHGSLEEITVHAAAHTTSHRPQLLINIAYMLDAARAVAYLHSFTPAFLHRDIKPANFLVDNEGIVKLTDFGESRSLPRQYVAQNATRSGELNASTGIVATLTEGLGKLSSGAQLQRVRTSEWHEDIDATRMTIKGTIDYMAPELINGKGGQAAYGEAVDVYALGITLWDLLYPGQEKYPAAHGNHLRIYEAVSAGQRPVFQDNVHGSLRTLIESAWHADPRLRPSAQNVVDILESIQEEIAAVFASKLLDRLRIHKILNYQVRDLPVFEGDRCIELMERRGYVLSIGEAVRVGNALMDAGFLHHAAHAQAFDHSQESFFLEETAIAMCEPLDTTRSASAPRSIGRHHAMSLGPSPSSPTAVSTTTKPDSDSVLGTNNGLCACRKLSQHMVEPKRSRRRHRPFKRVQSQRPKPNGFFAMRSERRHDGVVTSPGEPSSTEIDDFADFVEEIPRLSGVHEGDSDDDDNESMGVLVQ